MTRSPWLVFTAICATAIARALLAKSPSAAAAPADAVLKHGAFVDVQTHTAEMRRTAANDFPTDSWSQDDSFHEQERTRARNYASAHRISMQDALDGIDEGIRDRANSAGDSMAATVVPCRPRAIY